jgi:hypothetical protein
MGFHQKRCGAARGRPFEKERSGQFSRAKDRLAQQDDACRRGMSDG